MCVLILPSPVDACSLPRQDWDVLRNQRTDALDSILESLGTQLVPPDFHQSSAASSLFGSQHSDEESDDRAAAPSPLFSRSPTATLRSTSQTQKRKTHEDRRKWKTLRDFVDERAIEDALESMEAERAALDVRP